MLDSAYQDVPESPEERMERRRTRRWKRRARIAGPFLGVTMMLGALTLSVDLIEYQPQEPQQRLTDRPIPRAVLDKQQLRRIQPQTSVSATSVVRPERLVGHAEERDLDLTIAPEKSGADQQRQPEHAPPSPSYSTPDLR